MSVPNGTKKRCVIPGFEPRLNGSLTRRPLSPSRHSPPPRVPTGHRIPAQSTALGTTPRTHPHVLKERRTPARPQGGMSHARREACLIVDQCVISNPASRRDDRSVAGACREPLAVPPVTRDSREVRLVIGNSHLRATPRRPVSQRDTAYQPRAPLWVRHRPSPAFCRNAAHPHAR